MDSQLERVWRACRAFITRAGLVIGLVPAVPLALYYHQWEGGSSFSYGRPRVYTYWSGSKGWRYAEIGEHLERKSQAGGHVRVKPEPTSGSLENATRTTKPDSFGLIGEAVAQLRPFDIAGVERAGPVYPQFIFAFYRKAAYRAELAFQCRAPDRVPADMGEWTVADCASEARAAAATPAADGPDGQSAAHRQLPHEPLRIRKDMAPCARRAIACLRIHAGMYGSGSSTIAGKLYDAIRVSQLRSTAGGFESMFEELRDGKTDIAFVVGGLCDKVKEVLANPDIGLASIEVPSIPDVDFLPTVLPLSKARTDGMEIKTLVEVAWLGTSKGMPAADIAIIVRWLIDYHEDLLLRSDDEGKRDIEATLASLQQLANKFERQASQEYVWLGCLLCISYLVCSAVIGVLLSLLSRHTLVGLASTNERRTEQLLQRKASSNDFAFHLLEIVHGRREVIRLAPRLLGVHRSGLEERLDRVEADCWTQWQLVQGDGAQQTLRDLLEQWLRQRDLTAAEYRRLSARTRAPAETLH